MKNKHIYQSLLVSMLLIVLSFTGCVVVQKTESHLFYMSFFIPGKFAPGGILQDDVSFNVYVDNKINGKDLKIKKGPWLSNVYRLSNQLSYYGSICFGEGYHEVTLSMVKNGEELFLPIRERCELSSKYKDEPREYKISQMFASTHNQYGVYWIQFSLKNGKDIKR